MKRPAVTESNNLTSTHFLVPHYPHKVDVKRCDSATRIIKLWSAAKLGPSTRRTKIK